MIKFLIGWLLRQKSFNYCILISFYVDYIIVQGIYKYPDVLGSEPVVTMGYAAATVLAFAAVAFTSVGSNTLEDSRNIDVIAARQPLLARLSRQSPPDSLEREVKSLDEQPQLILVQVVLNINSYFI